MMTFYMKRKKYTTFNYYVGVSAKIRSMQGAEFGIISVGSLIT